MELKDAVIKAQNGDSNAFATLFEQTQKMVYFTALKFTANESAAEDLTQDVYIKAMENLKSLKTPEAFVSWLRQITVNVCKNYLASRKPNVLGEDENDEMLAGIPEVEENFIPHEYADNRETCRLIMAMVDSLPESQRIAVILYYYNELTVSRIAEILKVSENTVKSRLNYARRQIKEQVEDLEKKGTKLHAVPVLGLVLKNAAEGYTISASAASAIIASVTATTVATTTAATTAAGGILAKISALPLVTKVIAGVLGLGVVIGAGAGIASVVNSPDGGEDLSGIIVSTEAQTTAPVIEDENGGETEEVLLKLRQNEIFGLGVNNGDYVPEIVVNNDGTFTFYCNLYYGMITYSGKWEKTDDGITEGYNFTVETYVGGDGVHTAVNDYDLPIKTFTVSYKKGAQIAQFGMAANAYFGMTADKAYFDIVGEGRKMTNGEVMAAFVSKFEQNNGTLYSYADVTHDGYVEMFAVRQDGYACEFQVYTLEKGEPKLIYEGYSDNTTNGLHYYDLYTEDLYEYIMCAGFYYRQGSPLFYYYIFSLDNDGNVKMFAKNEYNADSEVAENEEEILSEIRHEYNVYAANCNCPIIGEQNGDVYPGAWEYSRFLKYPEIFDGIISLKKENELRFGKYSYTVADGKVKLGRYNYIGITDETEAVVPAEIDGYPVTTISWNTFNGHFRLKSIEIHENITSIEEKAFDNCSKLEYIKCPAGSVAEKYAIEHGISVKHVK